jgi:dipeptidyl aminopeptidase/acylaminoacyl peptidase
MVGRSTMVPADRIASLRICVAAVTALLSGSAPAPAAARALLLDDLYRLRTVSDPRISPDGAWVAYVVSTPNRDADADDTDLWLVSWDGKERRRLTDAPAPEHSPRWSPDGRRIAFLTDRGDPDAGDQLWVLERAGGEAVQHSRFEGTISTYDWSPDGARIVFAAVKSAGRAAPAGAGKAAEKPIVIERLQFKQDEEGYLPAERSHLYELELASGTVTQWTDGEQDDLQPGYAPDGRRIAFLSKRGADPDRHNNWDVCVMDARAGAPATPLTTNPGMDGDPTGDWGIGTPRFSPDGVRVAYLAGGAPQDIWYGLVQVGVIAADGGAAALPTARLDRNTIDPGWSADGRSIYFRLEDDLGVQLARVRMGSDRVERLTAADGTVTAFDAGARGRIALVRSTSDHPTELYALDRARLRALSEHNAAWTKEVELARAAAIGWRGRDGERIHGLLIAPRNRPRDARLPALLDLHGGPVAQHQHEFDFAWQWFAARGYAVIAPNPRGSSGRGYRFQRLLFAQWGLVDVPDVLTAVDHAVAMGVADPRRLGVGGWSYGGMLTNYVIASDARFRAAVSGAGAGNMLAAYGTDQYVREWEIELGLPWDNTELWLRLSFPFLQARRIGTPTLFLCAGQDWNMPCIGSEQMYQALRRLEVPTQLVVYPGEPHGLDRPSHRADRLQRHLDWYDRYLRNP